MLVCDDLRRIVDANVAACLFLRASREHVLTCRIDDLLAPPARSGLPARWSELLAGRDALQLPEPPGELALADGSQVAARLSMATHSPGRHVVIVDFAPVRALVADAQNARSASRGVLTKREREVLTLVAAGKTGIAIAAQLLVAPTTVQAHVNNALLKLNARNRAHGVAVALRTGELELDEPSLHSGSASISPIRS